MNTLGFCRIDLECAGTCNKPLTRFKGSLKKNSLAILFLGGRRGVRQT